MATSKAKTKIWIRKVGKAKSVFLI